MKAAWLSNDLLLTARGEIAAVPEPGGDIVDLRTLLREHFAGLDARSRQALLRSVVTAIASSPAAMQSHKLRRNLFELREALRERLPIVGDDARRGAARGVAIEGLLRIDERSFYAYGWAFDDECDVRSLEILTPEGVSIDLLARAYRFPHPDADGFYSSTFRPRNSGFACYFEPPLPDPLPEGWVLTMQNAQAALEARAPRAVDRPHETRQVILSHLRHDRNEVLLAHHAHPALRRIQASLVSGASVAEHFAFGKLHANPFVTLVIPLFGRTDLVENQLAAFARDAELCDVEILYVLDSPELADALRAKARELFDLFRLPVRFAVMNLNCGLAAACNAGAQLAEGRRLVLMHSDVIPAAPGWVGRLTSFYDTADAPGAVGATLLYHDESIQHAGYAVNDDGVVTTPGKGLHKELVAPASPQRAAAVSGACMMVDREQFIGAGGFAGCYAGGDGEDVELCARLASRGRHNWLLPQVQLYHLEGQSRPAKLQDLAEPYDRWLLARRWRDLTKQAVKETGDE